jgi:rare lipoprotein A
MPDLKILFIFAASTTQIFMKNNRKNFILPIIAFLFFSFSQSGFAQENTQTETGKASWYGSKYHGRKTSSGELYNKNDMTAAHKTLPFGTKVKVTNRANDKSVIVRINDRGPFVGKRIIDVSEVAARKLGFHKQGIGNVHVEVLPEDHEPLGPNFITYYTIEAGAYTDVEKAQAQSQKLKEFDKNLSIKMEAVEVKGAKIHRLKVGEFDNKQHAEAFNDLLKEDGLGGRVSEV